MDIKNSIQKFNQRLFSQRRELAVRLRQKRQREEAEAGALEILIDDILLHTGIPPTKANMPLIVAYITQAVKDARGQPQEEDDPGAINDHQF